uniref:E3 ubiquitin-protein ligase n=1 Tax=Angiostrongylus cantonensis TaxID=6313 RepID=A0A0K0D7K6_ANGCA
MVTRAWRMLIGHRHSAHLRQIPKECISSTDPVYQLIDLNGLQKEIDSDMIKTLEDFMLRFQLMFTNMFIFVHSSGIVRVYTKEMYNECYSEYERMLSQEMKAYHLYQKRGKHLMDSMFSANSGSEVRSSRQ